MNRDKARWLYILLPILVFWMVANIDKLSVSVIVTSVGFQNDMGLVGNTTAMGLLATVFSVSYGSCSYVWGFIVDRFGPRWAAVGAATIWGLTLVVAGLAGSFGMVLASRLLLGVGEGALYVVSSKYVGNWFERRNRARAQSIWVLGGPLGPVIGVPVLVFTLSISNWRGAFFLLAALSFFVVIPLLFFLTRDAPEPGSPVLRAQELDRQEAARLPVGLSVPATFGELLRTFRFWCSVVAFLMGSFAFAGLAFWLPTYLKTERHFPADVMATWTSASWLLAVLGVITVGWLSDRTQRPALIGAVACVIGAVAMCVAALTDSPSLAAAMLAVGLAMINCESTICQILSLNIAGPHLVGRGAGVMTGTGSLIGGFGPLIIGWIVSVSAGSFVAGVLFLVGCMTLAALAFSAIAVSSELVAARRAAAAIAG